MAGFTTDASDVTRRTHSGAVQEACAIFGAAIGVVTFAHYVLRMNAILAFWLAYILTRPLGASIGDYLSQPSKDGGLALGTTGTSVIFLLAISILVAYLAITKRDRTELAGAPRALATDAA